MIMRPGCIKIPAFLDGLPLSLCLLEVFRVLLFCAFIACVSKCLFRKQNKLPLPPGPKGLPIIGNLLRHPKQYEYKTYASWSKQYNSDILHTQVAGLSIVILNTRKVAVDLLQNRSSKYSGRYLSTMLYDLMGWDWLAVLMPYGARWRERRRLFGQYYHPNNTAMHEPQQIKYTKTLLHSLLSTPEDFSNHIKHMVSAIAIEMAYGLDVQPTNDPYVKLSQKAVETATMAATPGAFLVDPIPILKHVPEWFPGAGFKRKAREWRFDTLKMLEVPFAAALKEIASKDVPLSFTSACVQEFGDNFESNRVLIRDTAGQIFAGGGETTHSTLETFFLAMTCYPDVQKRAQEEIDSVVQGRLPEHSDRQSMPYLQALVKEVLRWNPVLPMSIPHLVSEDDEYKGYHIPSNSIVIANSWAMMNDETAYPEPLEFKPERYLKDGELDPTVQDPESIAFGFGRRNCIGKHIGLSTLWLMCASVLATFDITKPVDEHGNVIEPTREYLPVFAQRPVPFKCSIKPRSTKVEALLTTLA